MFPNEDRAEYEKYLDCKFCFEWDFEYNNSGKRFNVNKKINKGKSEITKIDISPISLWITVTGEQIDYKDVKDIKIQFNNGKEIVVTNKDYGIEYTPLQNGINRISCDFGEIVNINDLESISIGDQIINMK